MPITLKTVDFQRAVDTLKTELKKFRGDKFVTVGIHESAEAHEGTDLTMAQLGAVHEFGADIDHPGGTPYGYASPQAVERGEVRFLKKGTGYMELGVTQPHKVTIPARPWLVPGVESGTQEYLAEIASSIKKGDTLDTTLEVVGNIAAGTVQQFMTDLKSPPNAPSTVRKKGSDNPLIDTGALRSSVTYEVTSETPIEGIQ
jgi:phage gpG-like protein